MSAAADIAVAHWFAVKRSSLDSALDLQRLVPPPLELAGDQTIRRIHSSVLPACM